MPAKEAAKTTKPAVAAPKKAAAKPKGSKVTTKVTKANPTAPSRVARKARTIVVKKVVKAQPLKFTIDCSNPVSSGIIDISSFEKFLHDKFKPTRGSKAGVLGENVSITKQASSIVIKVAKPIRKNYLKYLTKRFLKKQQLRDWLRVVANARDSYELRYYNIQEAGDESESDEEDEE